MNMKKRKIASPNQWVFWGIAILWAVMTFGPFLCMIMSTLKDKKEFFKYGVFAIPKTFSFQNYLTVLNSNYWVYLRNSIVVVGISLVLLLGCSALAAFVFSRIRLKGNAILFGIVVACMSIPIHVSFIPIFLLSKSMGTYDTLWALIGPYVTFNIPISVFILTGFMRAVPVEIEESAQLDGCGYCRVFANIMLPLSTPGLITLAIYNGINMWNEFSFALILTQSVETRTLPLATWQFRGEYASDVPMIMTVVTMSALPMIIAFMIGQDRIIDGMMAGAVKG